VVTLSAELRFDSEIEKHRDLDDQLE
jgi:hypothetical protein